MSHSDWFTSLCPVVVGIGNLSEQIHQDFVQVLQNSNGFYLTWSHIFSESSRTLPAISTQIWSESEHFQWLNASCKMTIAIILYKSSTVVILNIGFRLKLSTNEIFYYSLSFMLRSMCAVQKQMNCEHISVIGLLKWFHITRRPYCRWIKIISILDFNILADAMRAIHWRDTHGLKQRTKTINWHTPPPPTMRLINFMSFFVVAIAVVIIVCLCTLYDPLEASRILQQ